MAQTLYSLPNTGGSYHSQQVVKSAGSSISTDALRLTVDSANAPNKAAVIRALHALADYINADTWPPA